MIDIHCHILPMVDDGSQSVDMSLDLLDQAYQDGTDEIILTPHYAYPYNFINPKDKIRELYMDLCNIVHDVGIPIHMYLGCEFLFDSVYTFEEHKDDIQRLNDTHYLLMEFFFNESGEFILEAIDTVIHAGYIPVIAHPERYDATYEDETLAKEMIEHGAVLQMNKGSILGRHGSRAKDVIFTMLDHHYISFVGSDAHHPVNRSSLMYESYQCVIEYYGKEYADEIFEENALKMLKDIDIRKENTL